MPLHSTYTLLLIQYHILVQENEMKHHEDVGKEVLLLAFSHSYLFETIENMFYKSILLSLVVSHVFVSDYSDNIYNYTFFHAASIAHHHHSFT